MSIQRYDIDYSVVIGPVKAPCITKTDGGRWVLYSEHLQSLTRAEAEVERLRHDIERHMALLTEFDNEVEQLRAERAALRADAERYRWLRREVDGPHVPLAQVLWKLNNIRDNFRWTNLSDGQTLDEHIDAARGES